MGTWYLGPTGALVVIPAPADGLDVSPTLVGAVTTSLGGTRTLYRSGQPRQWAMKWVALTEDQASYLRLVGLGQIRGPLRLIDAELRNRLPVRIAGGGSYRKTAADFSQTGGSDPTWVALSDTPATIPVRGAISWTRSTTAAGVLTTTAATDRVPLIPGEQVRISLWARGTPIQVSAGYDSWNALGANSRNVGTAATLDTTNWTYFEVLYTPPAGQIELSPLLNIAGGQAAGTVQTTGWQVAPATAPTTWTAGGGAPEVIAGSELKETYVMVGLRSFELLLLERRA